MTPSPVSALCARLRELEAKATRGPWRASFERGLGHNVDPPAIFGPNGEEVVATSEWLTFEDADRLLCAVLRNAAPRLLALVEAGEALAEAGHVLMECFAPVSANSKLIAFDAALSAYDAAAGEAGK